VRRVRVVAILVVLVTALVAAAVWLDRLPSHQGQASRSVVVASGPPTRAAQDMVTADLARPPGRSAGSGSARLAAQTARTAVSDQPTPRQSSILVAYRAQAISSARRPTVTPTGQAGPLTPSPTPLAPPAGPPTPVPLPPQSWLADATLLTIYGRAFGVAPILGQLGADRGFGDMIAQVTPYVQGIAANNGGKGVRVAVHLIYGLATPCSPGGNCLLYLDDVGVDIVKEYIEPAAKLGWLVVLDDQLGRSYPAAEMRRIIAKGYLAYDNVAIALDPEFRAASDQATPGIPVGAVAAAELNTAQTLLDGYSAPLHPVHRKLLLIHQFQETMIVNRASLRLGGRYVDPVVVADGFGPPATKMDTYTQLLGPGAVGRVRWRGLKLFYPNPYEQAGHGDYPVMTWPEVFGRATIRDLLGNSYSMQPPPDLIIIA